MPQRQKRPNAGIASSVAIFIFLSVICCMLSLSSPSGHIVHNKQEHGAENSTYMQKIRVPNYVPNIAMLWIMLFGITAMVILILKGHDLTTSDDDSQSINRHNLHRKFSLRSITAFFVGSCIFDINYIIVAISCRDKWTHCDDVEIVVNNSFEVVLHTVCVVFIGCETIICWLIRSLNFKSSLKVWHGLAVVQAANFALWFDSILKESGHRVQENIDSFEAYFDFCRIELENQSHSETGGHCTESSIEAQLSSQFHFFTRSQSNFPCW